ncbi:MAG: CHAT domain-containing protein [Methylococcales bacterium]
MVTTIHQFRFWKVMLLIFSLTCLTLNTDASTSPDVVTTPSMNDVSEAIRLGQFQRALILLDELEASFSQSATQSIGIDFHLKRSEILLASGKPKAAIEEISEALSTTQSQKMPSQQAALLGLMGVSWLRLGHIEKAVQYQQNSLKFAQMSGDAGVLAVSLNNLGNALTAQGDRSLALQRYQAGAEQAQQAGNTILAAKAWINAARLSGSLQSTPESIAELLNSAEQAISRSESSHDKALTLISLSQLYLQSTKSEQKTGSDLQKAHTLLSNAVDLSRTINDKLTLSYALGYSGQLYLSQARYKDALQLVQQATFIAQEIDHPELLYRWQWLTGRILNHQGQNNQAIIAYQQAIDTLQPIRLQLIKRQNTSEQSFRDGIGAIYFELADLLLRRYDTVEDKMAVEDLMDARQTVERFKSLELEDYFQDDCVAALQAKTRGVDNLSANTAALYPVVLPDRLELLVNLPSGMKKVTVAMNRAELTAQIRTLRLYLEKRTTRQYLPAAQALYKALILPIEPWLKEQSVDTLVFIPDGSLRTIPLAALHDGNQFLIEKFAIATSPGLTLTDPRTIPRKDTQILLNGLTEGVQDFSPLPFVEQELQQIADLYQSHTILKNEGFRVNNLREELADIPYRIVHIASHGQFNADNRETFVLAYDNKISMNTLEDLLGLSRYRNNPVELLTLSACQTAAGDDRAALGLAGVAIKAGARSALASLWFINDRASSVLVTEFYRQLQNPKLSKAKALQQAQLILLKQRRYRHPSLWAPFLLIGNWL